jgi:hypothetical protein
MPLPTCFTQAEIATYFDREAALCQAHDAAYFAANARHQALVLQLGQSLAAEKATLDAAYAAACNALPDAILGARAYKKLFA